MKQKYKVLLAAFTIGILTLVYLLFLGPSNRKLSYMESIYTRVDHPSWSERVLMKKAILPNMGSGDHSMLFLVDVRKVEIEMSEAIAYYKQTNKQIGITEFHVDPVDTAKSKFGNRWGQMKIGVPIEQDIMVITLMYSSDTGQQDYLKAEPVR